MVRASVLTAPSTVETDEFPLPEKGTIIQVEATGVCGTDPHIYSNNIDTPHPMIMGHELLGIIYQVEKDKLADSSDDVNPGDRVFIAPGIDCNDCFYCKNLGELCSDRKFYGINLKSDQPPHLHGGFAEFLSLIPGTTLLKVPEGMSTEVAALIEPMACGIRAVKQAFPNLERIKNSTVVILGTGPIGLFATIAARIFGAKKIITIDRLPHRLQFARDFGADLALDRSQHEKAELTAYVRKQSNDNMGADVIIECTGENEAVEYGLPMLRKGGRFVEKGIYADTGTTPINPSFICTNNIEFVGTSYTHLQDFRDAIGILKRMDFPYGRIVTDKFGIDNVEQAIRAVIGRECMKIVIDPTINK